MSASIDFATQPAPPAGFDGRQLRDCFGTFVTGVTVITTVDAHGQPHGLTVNSFSSVSLDPPLVLWSQRLEAPSYPVFRDAPFFAVNILAEDQIDVSRRFSNSKLDKFAGLEFITGKGGIPLIAGCSAHLECASATRVDGGDHAVFFGKVEGINASGRPPLAFGGGRYMVVQPHSLA